MVSFAFATGLLLPSTVSVVQANTSNGAVIIYNDGDKKLEVARDNTDVRVIKEYNRDGSIVVHT